MSYIYLLSLLFYSYSSAISAAPQAAVATLLPPKQTDPDLPPACVVLQQMGIQVADPSPSADSQSGEPGAISASADGAWQKRGSGRAYNSLSGTCAVYILLFGHMYIFFMGI